MKKIVVFLLLISAASLAQAQSKEEKAVAAAVEALRVAMVNADSVTLDKLTSDQLSYGHSSGHVEGKSSFINKISSGRSDFVSIELPDQVIIVSGKTALVRHTLNAVTNDGGKAGEVHLSVLLVWQKQHGDWKLLARQAVKKA